MLSVALGSSGTSYKADTPIVGVVILVVSCSFSFGYVSAKLLPHMALEWFRAAVLPIVATLPMSRDKREVLLFKEM